VITFVILAALMVAAALVWVLVPLLGRHQGAASSGKLRTSRSCVTSSSSWMPISRAAPWRASNTNNRAASWSSGCSRSRRPFPRRAAKSHPAPARGPRRFSAARFRSSRWCSYLVLGGPQALIPATTQQAAAAGKEHDLSPQQVEAMVDKLVARLEKEPGNAEGWVVLARTYYSMNRFPEAAKAFERAVALVPDNADLLADYADALGAVQGNTLAGKPMQLIERALKIDPTHWKALALAGTAAFDRKDYKTAVELWERLKKTVPPDARLPPRSTTASPKREPSAIRAGRAAVAAASPVPPSSAASGSMPGAPPPRPCRHCRAQPSRHRQAQPGARRTGRSWRRGVHLRACRAGAADAAGDSAQAGQGPSGFVLSRRFDGDDSEMKLSNFPSIVVGARISKSGNAVPQSGDLEGLSHRPARRQRHQRRHRPRDSLATFRRIGFSS